jgi:N-acetylated-alpha-linked acidic dipeptidase
MKMRLEARLTSLQYFPIMNKPVSRSVDILLPEGNGVIEWSATLREDIVEGDPTSVLRDEVPVFHGLSVSGNVTGPILFVGYGTKRDFEDLERAGIDAKGAIVLVKYGKVFRGLKVKAAQEAGAIGCLIYSDPGDDGEITIENGYEVYPNGPARNPSSVQRGSVQFLSSVSSLPFFTVLGTTLIYLSTPVIPRLPVTRLTPTLLESKAATSPRSPRYPSRTPTLCPCSRRSKARERSREMSVKAVTGPEGFAM